jgi:hypothetical protein
MHSDRGSRVTTECIDLAGLMLRVSPSAVIWAGHSGQTSRIVFESLMEHFSKFSRPCEYSELLHKAKWPEDRYPFRPFRGNTSTPTNRANRGQQAALRHHNNFEICSTTRMRVGVAGSVLAKHQLMVLNRSVDNWDPMKSEDADRDVRISDENAIPGKICYRKICRIKSRSAAKP